jgi:chemotaxis protein CheC
MGNINITSEQLDALREIGNIGAGNAASALGQLLGKQISISVPNLTLLNVDEVSTSKLLPHSDDIGIAVSSNILGTLAGGMIVLYSQKSALLMIDILMHRKIGSTKFFNIMDASALAEGSNILCCSYLNAVVEFLKLYKLIPSVSQVYMDKMDRLTEVLIKSYTDANVGCILPIENHLTIEDIELNLFVLFMLELESVNRIFRTVGL